MALIAAGSSVAVSTLPGSNSSCVSWRSASNSGIVASGHRRSGVRLALERKNTFLSNYSFGESGLGQEDCLAAADGHRGRRTQCYAQGRGGRGGGVFFLPFGTGRGAGGRGTSARAEWERRQIAQQQRLREMFDREIQARSDVKTKKKGCSGKDMNRSYEFLLLRELEKRLRAEEIAGREDGGDEKVEEQSVRGEERTKASAGASTYELMKELEKRLRAERESQRGSRENPRARGRGELDRSGFNMGNYESLYEYMKEWNREVRERRVRLEAQWKSRGEDRVIEKTEKEEEERIKDKEKKKRQEKSVRGEFLGTAAEEKRVVDDDNSNAEAAPKYPQSNGTVVYLKNEANGAEIYFVGTSHVSQKSVDEVKEVIERVKPDFVMVELCRKRYESMKLNVGRGSRERDSPMAFVERVVQMLTNGNVGVVGKLVGVGLASFYRLLSYRGFHPGKEFEVAIKEGRNVGAKIVLGDQDIDTTLKHLGEFNLNTSMQDAFKFFGQSIPDDIAWSVGGKAASNDDLFERVRDRKVVRRLNEEMEKGAPVLYKALVAERNEVMVKALRNLTGKVVAVVGLAHMDGMEQLWHQANEKYFSGQLDATEGQK